MEEARQHSALSNFERLFRWTWLAGVSAFVIGAAGQFIFGGFWLQEGLTVFFWLRFALACLRVRMFADKGKPRRNWEKVNALVHFLLAVAVTYALNAVVIERYFN